MILGCFRLAKYAGSFDLLVYSHKKLARSGKNSDLSQEEKDPGSSAAPAPEQLGSYSDYLTQKKPAATYKEPLLAGGVFILASPVFDHCILLNVHDSFMCILYIFEIFT